MSANYRERVIQLFRSTLETEIPIHPPLRVRPRHQRIECRVVPREASGSSLKHPRKTEANDLRSAFMASDQNNEPLEHPVESDVFVDRGKLDNNQGQAAAPMEEPQPERQRLRSPERQTRQPERQTRRPERQRTRQRDLPSTQAPAPEERPPQGPQHAAPATSSRGPSFRQRAQTAQPKEPIRAAPSPAVLPWNLRFKEGPYWDESRLQRHAELGNQIDRRQMWHEAQEETLYPPPPGTNTGSTSLGRSNTAETRWSQDDTIVEEPTPRASMEKEKQVRQPRRRIPINCPCCGPPKSEPAEANQYTGRRKWFASGSLRDSRKWRAHAIRSRKLERAEASIKGLWWVLQRRLGWYHRFGPKLEWLFEEAHDRQRRVYQRALAKARGEEEKKTNLHFGHVPFY